MADFVDESIITDYLSESRDILASVENDLVALEKNPKDAQLLNQIFRGFHTIKGGAGFIQAEGLVKICHSTEFLFDRLREGSVDLDLLMMDDLLAVTACITDMFDSLERSAPVPEAPADLLSRIGAFSQGKKPVEGGQKKAAAAAPTANSTAEVKETVAPAAMSVAPQNALASATASALDWDALFAAATGQPTQTTPASTPATVSPAVAMPTSVAGTAASSTKTRTMAVATQDHDKGAAAEHKRRRPDLKMLSRQEEKSVRVDTRRLDKVLNLSGEIGLVRNSLRNICSGLLSSGLNDAVISRLDGEVNRLNAMVNSLHESAMRIRMQPIGRLFHKYQRTIRDIARSLDKAIDFSFFGEETELDKTMVEELNDPLVHMLRNAIDHGIEKKQERLQTKKPPAGKITLSAAQEGDHVVIRLEDDGRGMDPEKLRRIAVKKQIISEDDALKLSDVQSLKLIFAPGFSSAESVTNLSGRGVGMDVVMTNLKNMNGDVEIYSVVGSGTTFELRVPLTLMMMPIVVVGLNEHTFAIPLSLVREVIPIHTQDLYEINGYAACKVRNDILPIIDLAGCLSWSSYCPPNFGVVISYADVCVILGVDRFYRRDEAVVRSLNAFKPKGITGMSTSSEGESILILDIKDLAPLFNQHKIPRHQWTRLFATYSVESRY